jgi:hypothetical protein
LASNGLQLIQVALETTEGLVVVERIAALNGQIVSIVINEADLKLGGDDTGGRYGSKVIVENKTTTSTNIAAMYVYNKDNVASSVIYYLDIASPPNSSKSLYILSTVGLPIVDGERYAVKLAVMGNGYSVLIDKEFNEGSDLYSKNPDTHVRTITLNQADLPPELVETFVPVVNVSGLYNELESYYDTNSEGSDPQLKFAASINLNHSVTISPDTASKKSPITWSKSGEGKDYVAINADGVLTVTGIPSNGADKVLTIGVSIADAAGTVGARTTFTDTFSITLKYVKTGVRTQQVTSLSLSNGEVQAGYTLDLKSLVTLSPAGANIDGVLISKEDLVWYINGSVNSGSTYTAPASGTSSVSVYAVLPSGKNNGTQVVSPTTTITITSMAPPFVSVTGVTPVGGGSLSLFYYTKTVGSSGVKTFVQGSQLNLGGSVTVSPSNATNQTITWSAASTLPAGVALNDGVLAVTGIPGSSTATVKATIVGGVSNGNFSANLTVNLVEYHSRLLDSSELLVSNGTVEVGKTLDLVNLVTLPSGLYVNLPGSSLGTITKDDLTWSLSNGNASLAGTSILTGKTAGTLTVTATLPANKNGGTAVSASGTITVKAATPSTFTLRVIKVPHVGDGIYKIAVVPATNTFSESVYQTGYTGLKWADKSAGSYNGTHKNSFPKLSLAVGATYYTVSKFGQAAVNGTLSQVKKDNDWVDLTLPWPSGGITGYMVFFIEADGRVRGYCNPADGLEASGAVDKNFLFYIRPDYLYANRLLPMGTTSSNGHLEVNPSTTSYREVIPVSYTDWENVASIMTSRGAGQRPKLNYTGLDVSKIDYKE